MLENFSTRPESRELEGKAMAEYLAMEVRKEYRDDEAAIIEDALQFKSQGLMETLRLTLFSPLNLSSSSRLLLIEKMMMPANEEEGKMATFLLELSDTEQNEIGAVIDLSGHVPIIGKDNDLPAEYLFYLFRRDGEQAWKLLGGSAEKSPTLSELKAIDMSAGRMGAVRKWTNEIRPALEGRNFPTTMRDACYLARYLCDLYGDAELARQANPEIMKQIDQSIPGLGAALVEIGSDSMDKVPRTPPAKAAAWLQRTRAKLK